MGLILRVSYELSDCLDSMTMAIKHSTQCQKIPQNSTGSLPSVPFSYHRGCVFVRAGPQQGLDSSPSAPGSILGALTKTKAGA